MSLRARLLAGMAFVAVVLVVVAIVITSTTRSLLTDQIDARLAAFSPGGRVTTISGDSTGSVFTAPPPVDPGGFPDRASDAYEGVVTADGTLVTRFTPNVGESESSPPALDPDDLPSAGTTSFTTDSIDGATTYRVLAQRFGDAVAITALPLDDVQDTISSLIRVEVIGVLMILASLGLVSWWVVHLGIRPIKKMTATATRIAGGDLTVRVPETADGTESAELAVALNQMLVHIEGAFDERAKSEDRLRRFVADASHELRTPVTTIRGYAELYRIGGLAEPDALDDAMRRTEQEATRMGRLVEDMLVLARLDEQRPLANLPIDLAALVRDASSDAGATWPDRAIAVHDVAEPAIVTGDEDRLRQVLANVVGNALVHTDASVSVDLTVIRDDDNVVVEVADNGAGMPADVAARVTERFYRADPARSRHRGGSGLGLAIVDAAVAAHGGAVAIRTGVGEGTTVRLTLPRRRDGEASR
jgi:two-component system OmpR family sensor kinase